MKRISLTLLFVFALLLVACEKKAKPPPLPPLVEVEQPKVEDAHLFNAYIGHLLARVQVEVKAQVEGVLTGFYFTEGEQVKKGDLLFTIDSRPFEANLARAEAGFAKSLATLRYAEDVARRNARLSQEDYVSKMQYDEYITNVLTAKAESEQFQAQIQKQKINISYCNIHAPMDAVTGQLKIDAGNLIKNAEETPLVLLNQITPIYAYFSVPQKDLSRIMDLHRKEPLKVEAYLEKNDHNPFVGVLDLIDNQVDEKTGSIWLRGLFPNKDKLLWSGAFVKIRLMLKTMKNALLIPTEAVSIGQKGKYVFVITEQDTAEMRYVKTSQRMGNMTIITEGIHPHDQIVVQGKINLSPGKRVRIK